MSEDRNRRGRPKGTGIDDRGQLERIAALLAADPDLKPTTAIKSLGVTDPSVIRRLRDKFHEARLELMNDVAGGQPDTHPAPAAGAVSGGSRPLVARVANNEGAARAIPARVIGQSVRKAPPPTRAPAPARAARPRPAPESAAAATATDVTKAAPAAPSSPTVTATHTSVDPASWLFAVCGFGIMAASAALEAQAAWAKQFVRLPPMAMALRQHIALNELTMTLVTPSATTRASFH